MYYCPDWTNLTLQGNWYSPEFKDVKLVYDRCSGTGCATDEEFEQWFKEVTIFEIIISSFFDVSDFSQPIQYFLDDIYVSMNNGRSVVYETYIKRNIIELHDDFLGLFNDLVEDTFYQMSSSRYFTADDTSGPGKGRYFVHDFKIDKEYDVYERKVYTISGVLQDVGGFYNSLFFLGLVIYSKFQGSFYFSSVISKLYQVESIVESKRKTTINKRFKPKVNDSTSIGIDESSVMDDVP